MTRAELLAATLTTLLAATIALPYLSDAAGLSIDPIASALAATISAVGVYATFFRRARPKRVDTALLVTVVAAFSGYLAWLAMPGLLPPGSGPDLTHHLQLVDYIERHGRLVHDPAAGAYLGEMAHYTPGVHLLAVITGAVARTDGFHAIYPVVAFSVALKIGVVLLILLRLLNHSVLREPLAVAGVLMIAATSSYSVSSFTHDSFLAQVASELFAIFLWWALVWWEQQPSRGAMALFAIAGVATFLTWPVWIGPPVVTLAVLTLMRRDMSRRRKAGHIALALGPIAGVAIIHAIGRASWISIVGTSGAVLLPSPAMLGSGLPMLALLGLISAVGDWRYRTLVVFAGSIILQSAALWVVAGASGADTPYMAIKMTYLAIYPAVAAAVVALAGGWALFSRLARPADHQSDSRDRQIAWAVIAAFVVLVGHDRVTSPRATPVVSEDLWQAGRWARDNVRPACVDYLVGHEDTAYWLHLAVLGNVRASARTDDVDTFRTEPSMARWILGSGMPYAIASLDILPDEIRRDVHVLKQVGSAAVIGRREGDTCK